MGHQRDWIDILQALLTPTIALIAVAIGVAQWWTARNKLRLDLFNTRWAVYGATRDLLTEMFTLGKISSDAEAIFLRESRGARWLFDERVDAYLRKLWAKAVLLKSANSMLEPTAPPPARDGAERQKNDVLIWMTKQDVEVDRLFSPFLKMDEAPLEWLRAASIGRSAKEPQMKTRPTAENNEAALGRPRHLVIWKRGYALLRR